MRRVLFQFLILLFLGLAVGAAHSWGTTIMLRLPPPAPSTDGGTPVQTPTPGAGNLPTTSPTSTPTATPPSGPPAAAANPYYIELPEAKKHFDEGTAIFVDARAIKEFREGHIRGAMRLTKEDFGGGPPAKVKNYLVGQRVIVYCVGSECTDSEAVIKRLIACNLQMGPYHIIKDGFPGWQKAGYPVETGDEVGFE